jgi:hypothetical protein
MKTRLGFVSNSSSSSFVVIEEGKNMRQPHILEIDDGVLTVNNEIGECEFGWEERRYSGFHTKLNFAYLQALYVMGQIPEWIPMLEETIKEFLPEVKEIRWELTEEWPAPGSGYIDHQSASYEGRNTKIFNDKETLKRFLFDADSYIEGGNDNGY